MPADTGRQPFGEFLRGWPLRAGVLIVFLAGVSFAFYVAASRGKPNERDRVTHPVGYSIVTPHDWTAKIVLRTRDPSELDRINLDPKNWQGLSPSIWVRRLAAAPDEPALRQRGFIDGTFQGQSALTCLEKKKRQAVQRTIFRRGDTWFEVGTELPGVEMTRLAEWWTFAETFRAPSGAHPSAPTTAPHVDGSTSSTSMR